MNHSESLGELFAALAKAQGQFRPALKSSTATITKQGAKAHYADITSILDAVREPLASNGLSVLQPARVDGCAVTVTTILGHSSGQWVSEDLTLVAADDSVRAVGSAITYARRYALSPMLGVTTEDDDGLAASEQAARQAQEEEEERRAAKLAEKLAAKRGAAPGPAETPAETPLEEIVRLRRAMFDRAPVEDEAAAWKGIMAKYGVASAKDLDAAKTAELAKDLGCRIEEFDRQAATFRPAPAGGLAQPAA